MKNALCPPFSNATLEVFKLMLDLTASAGAPRSVNSFQESGDEIRVAVGITGDLTGDVYYRFPKDTTLKIVNIMSGMEFDQVDEFVTSALGEIANIISGNAMTSLSEQNLACDILPPRFIGSDAPEDYPEEMTMIDVNTSIGNMALGVHVKPIGE